MTIAGISHVSLTVTDLGRARAFWVDVMRFALKVEQPGLLIVTDLNASVVIACVTHDDGDSEAFDERRVGLNHLALAIDGIDALRSWETALEASNVVQSPIVESPSGWHVNLRAPEHRGRAAGYEARSEGSALRLRAAPYG